VPLVREGVALYLNPRNVFRLARLAFEGHVRVVRSAVVFAIVAPHAGADEIFPG